MLYLINFSILSQSDLIFHVSLTIIYYVILFEDYTSLNILRLKMKTSLDLIYILPYYLYLVHIIYYLYLTKTNLSISISYLNRICDKQRKKTFLCVDLCVLHNVMLWNISFPGWWMVFSKVLLVVAKYFSFHQLWWQSLVNGSLISQFRKSNISFNFQANTLAFTASPALP